MIETGSEVVRVTFYEDRAEVVRRARAAVAAGTSWIEVGGLGVAVDDASLVVRPAAPGGPRVLVARVHRQVRQASAAGAAELAAMEEDLRAARARRVRAERALSRASAEERRVAVLLESWLAGVGRVPRGGAGEVERWKLVHESLGGALATALDQTSASRLELELAQLDEARAGLRLGQGRALTPRFEAAARVQVEAAGPGSIELELGYRTPCAAWRPEHQARLDPATGQLTITTMATAWQRTGERWTDVPCRFSTARPAREASPPLIADDVVRLQRRAEKTVTVEARDLIIAQTGTERTSRLVEEMPGVEDGGEPLWFEARRPITVPADGAPTRVEVAEVRLPCTVELICAAEVATAAHVRASATLTGALPLLAGPVRVARGASIVGRARLGFVGQGEPFELGFGAEDGLRVRRTFEDKRETTAVMGTQRLTRTVRVYVSNLGDTERRLGVIERVPVSEIEDVTVKVIAAPGAKHDKDGFARFEIDVPAGGTRELELIYRVEAGAKVSLNL